MNKKDQESNDTDIENSSNGTFEEVDIRKKPFLKKPYIYLPIIIVVVLAIAGGIYYKATKKPEYKYIEVQKGTIMQEVSVTGRVKPAESVDLALRVGGKINAVYAKVGDKVYKGQLLVALDNNGLSAQLAQANANLDAEKVKLDELKKGTRPEEIQQAETDLASAKSKADADLQEDYEAALTAVQEGVVDGKNALLTLSDLQFKYFTGSEQESLEIADAKKEAVKILLGIDNAGRLGTEDISKLTGGAFGLVQTAITNPTYSNIDVALSATLDGLQKVKNLLDIVPIKTGFTSAEKTSLSTEKTTIGASITAVSSKSQAVAVQKVTNANSIASAQDNLNLKKAGSTPEQISAQEAKVKSFEANVRKIEADIRETIISSPINGVVTSQDAKVGEIISANVVLVSLISDANFEIESFIPEVDVSKISIGDSASITLDAYGSDAVFEASVASVEPAETIIEGVATYKTILQFIEDDERIKSGMTANIDIMTDKREDVLYIPARLVITKDGKKITRILEADMIRDVEVTTGIRGSLGNLEILNGLKEGDKVLTE